MRSKGRTRQRCSLHTGGPSDAIERNEPAPDGQAAPACRIRTPAVDLVQRLGAAAPLPAAARAAEPTARGVRCHRWRLRRRASGPARAGPALRRGPPAGASPLSRRRSADRPLLWPGADPDRTVGNWLRQFTQATLAPLVQLNHDLVTDAIARLQL